MHPMAIQLKRAHQRVLLLGQSMLRSFGLTPARFDLLYVIHQRPHAPTQTELCQALGVSAATVSRMLRSLEELGIVERFKCYDQRLKYVALSAEGIALFRDAMAYMFGDFLSLKFQSAFGEPSVYVDLFVTKLEVHIEAIAKTFGDTATLDYAEFWEE